MTRPARAFRPVLATPSFLETITHPPADGPLNWSMAHLIPPSPVAGSARAAIGTGRFTAAASSRHRCRCWRSLLPLTP